MALPTFTRKAITAALRHSAEVAGGWLVDMRDDISTRLAALEGASGGSDLSTAPIANFGQMTGAEIGYFVVAHCHVDRTFSGAFIRVWDDVVRNDTNYAVIEIYELDDDGTPTGNYLAQSTSKITGGLALLALEKYALGPGASNPTGAFTIHAGKSAQASITMVGSGTTIAGGVIGLIPTA